VCSPEGVVLRVGSQFCAVRLVSLLGFPEGQLSFVVTSSPWMPDKSSGPNSVRNEKAGGHFEDLRTAADRVGRVAEVLAAAMKTEVSVRALEPSH